MAAFTLSPTLYGKVVGRFVAGTGDGVDQDYLPDSNPVTGNVTFTPSVSKVLVASGSPDPVTVELLPITAVIDSSGYLSFNGQQGVWLFATNDPSQNPSGWTYSVQYNLTYSGTTVDKSKFDIAVKSSDAANPDTWSDLSKIAPVATSAGVVITKGDPGPATNLTIGSVVTGPTATAFITGTPPNLVLNLVLPSQTSGAGTVKSINSTLLPDAGGNVNVSATAVGAVDFTTGNIANGYAQLDSGGRLPTNIFPNLTNVLPSGTVMYNTEVSGTYPPRPTTRTDVKVLWFGPDQPAIVTSGTAGMIDGLDSWFQTT